ncbi:anti-sigma factor family protein [Gimesia algae]|uniref:Putative zinc-finger domain-containing protein n=1 Tax=Gimesia algae TaxID=2527971 RepID=A0A517VNF8_9PLAN|nr:zf-HC2 domain-containing protein [Gimesia algae]QDT94523.1 hypothetical protein Pan161_62190 [Gimesia algae]
MNKNNPTQSSAHTDTEWRDCAPGDLCQFVSVMKKRKQISHLITGAEILTVCLVVGLIGFVGMNQMSGSAGTSGDQIAGKKMPGGINCQQALDYANDFIAHRLDTHTQQQMQVHLAHCPKCQKKVDEIEANMHNKPAQLKAARQKQADWEAYVLALNH